MALPALPQATSQIQNPVRMRLGWVPRSMKFESPMSGSIQRSYQWGRWEAELSWELLQQTLALPILSLLQKWGDGTTFTLYDPTRIVPRGTARGTASVPIGKVTDTPVTAGTSTFSAVFNASAKTIARAAGGLGVFLVGQQIVVAGSASNNATFTVAASTDTLLTLTTAPANETSTACTISYVGGQKGRLLTQIWPGSYAGQGLYKAGDLFSCINTGEVYEVTGDVVAGVAYGSPTNCIAAVPIAQYIRTSPANNEDIICEYAPFRMMLVEPVVPTISGGFPMYSWDAKVVEDLGLAS